MARLWQSGFELNSATAGVEHDLVNGTASISTTHVRSGTYAGRSNPTNSFGEFIHQFYTSDTKTTVYMRFYLYIATTVSANSGIFTITTTSGSGLIGFKLTTSNTLQLINAFSQSQLGSDSPALNTGQWYRVEVKVDATVTNTFVGTALLDGTQFATGSATITANGVGKEILGENGNKSCDIYFDDISINDSSGSSQTGYAGAGQIVHLQPNATGDNNAWSIAIGGTAGASNNYTRVSEVTPDDTTSYNGDATSGDIDDYKLTATPSSIGSSDTINTVAVGVRFRAVIAGSDATFVVRCKATSGGTVSESSTISPSTTTWVTNATAVPDNYPLVLYTEPGGSTPWSKADLDTSQIGMRINGTNTNAVDVSTIWMSIDSTPAVVTPASTNFFPFFYP